METTAIQNQALFQNAQNRWKLTIFTRLRNSCYSLINFYRDVKPKPDEAQNTKFSLNWFGSVVFIDTLPFMQCHPQSSINIKFSDWERSSLISHLTNLIFKFENRTDLIVENPPFWGYNCPGYMKASLHLMASIATPSKLFLELQRNKCNQRALDLKARNKINLG